MPLLRFTSKPGKTQDEFLAELSKKLSEPQISKPSSEIQEPRRPSSPKHNYEGVDTSFESRYRNLPLHLRSCLDYCSMFSKRHSIDRDTLVHLLLAEGLVQERTGEIADDTAKSNIDEFISLGMLQELDGGAKLRVPKPFCDLSNPKVDMQQFFTLSTGSHIRRVWDDPIDVLPDSISLFIRSFFSYSFEKGFSMDFIESVCRMKFLVVLDLDGKIDHLPDEVGDLAHLVYLGLKNSDLDELPKSLFNLQKLQTLDIPMCGKLDELPVEVLGMQELRHLIMSKSWDDCEIKVLKGIGTMVNLHTLSGLYAGGGIAEELSSLTKLKELGVKRVCEDHAAELAASIMKMVGLVSLSLEAEEALVEDTRATLFPSLEPFTPPPLLEDLYLHGGLVEIPNWVASMENLSRLTLSFSNLYENPSSVLQYLPNLKQLSLCDAWKAKRIGKEFCEAGGFGKLECLTIGSEFLVEWTEVEDGAFPSLKYLCFRCNKLMFLPEGLQGVSTLEQLCLFPLSHDLARRLQGQESYKIKHIKKLVIVRPFQSTFPE